MPHFKCVGCRTRLYSTSARADVVGDLCPGCGSLLEPVGELAEIVGFQSIQPRTGTPDDGQPSRRGRLASRVDRLFARRQAMLARMPLEAAEAIALVVPDEDP
jgi:Zn-finger nucleic acid-binding protein